MADSHRPFHSGRWQATSSARKSTRLSFAMKFPSFFCTAILCSNHPLWNSAFYNLTDCSPDTLSLISTARLQPASLIKHDNLSYGFICSHCRQQDFIQFSVDTFDQCEKQQTRIELSGFSRYPYLPRQGECRCVSSAEPIRQWRKVEAQGGKGLQNTDRVIRINGSAWLSLSLLICSVAFLVLFGGLISLFVYLLRLKPNAGEKNSKQNEMERKRINT